MSDLTQTAPIGFKTAVREAVGIFVSQQDLQAAIDDLLTSGFARCELSLRGAETDATAGRAPEALADDPTTTRTDHPRQARAAHRRNAGARALRSVARRTQAPENRGVPETLRCPCWDRRHARPSCQPLRPTSVPLRRSRQNTFAARSHRGRDQSGQDRGVVRRHPCRENTPLALRRTSNDNLISRRLRHQHQCWVDANPGVFARLRSFASNILKANRTDTLSQDRYRAGLAGIKNLLSLTGIRKH